jgi:type III restriction enzyme
MEPAVRFDARSTEFRLAHLLDDAPSVVCWLRLDGQIAYIELENGALYHPDFVVIDTDNVHWVVEGKADRDTDRPEVHARRQAAEEWATAVRDHAEFGDWRYLFVPEEVIKRALTWEELLARTNRGHGS